MADRDSELHEEEEEERRRGSTPALDEEIARKYDPQRLSRMVVRGAGRGERLDLATRGDMERLHPGHDFSDVRVFRGALAEEVTRRHGADAVTVANTGMILVRESPRSAPGTTSGRALLAHEVTHVAQAQRGLHFALERGSGSGSGGGHGDHEQEAEEIERSVHHRVPVQSQANQFAAEAARHRLVMARVFELLEEGQFARTLRTGADSE